MFSSFLKLKDPSEKKAVTPNVQYVHYMYEYVISIHLYVTKTVYYSIIIIMLMQYV